MDGAEVTIVVATFNRADALANAIRSARAQTREDWAMIVVGDACTDDTEAVVSGFGDPRIAFVNLPERFGEQAGPNSVGLALASTPSIAFLNHDDLWTSDHLDQALGRLAGGRSDLTWGRAAFFRNRGPRRDRGMFVEAHPPSRTIEAACILSNHYAEPLSAWVGRTAALQRVGSFALASETALFPLQDYVFRCRLTGLSFTAGEEVTVLKDRMGDVAVDRHDRVPLYELHPEYVRRWLGMIEAGATAELRAEIEDDLWLSEQLGLALPAIEPLDAAGPDRLAVHDTLGIDLLEQRLAARAQPDAGPRLIGAMARRRTGSAVAVQPRLDDAVAFARDRLHGRARRHA